MTQKKIMIEEKSRQRVVRTRYAYASMESLWSSSNFGRARRMLIFNAAVSANSHVRVMQRVSWCIRHAYRL